MSERVIRNLGDGLVLRRAAPDDVEALAIFNGHVHSDKGWDTFDNGVALWVRDLMTRPHPTFAASDFLVVEDTHTGEIVSSTNLIPQTWSYEGVEFGVGRIELVGTHPDYRRRGLVRAQFEVLHAWSSERGHKAQGITGIPYYYRQFEYEMALDMHGGRRGPAAFVPALKEDATEPYQVRPAQVADLELIAGLVNAGQQRSQIRCVRNAALWRYQLDGQTPGSAAASVLRIIETAPTEGDPGGDPVGVLAHAGTRWGRTLALTMYELKPGVSWWAVTPSVLRYLRAIGESTPLYYEAPDGPAFDTVLFGLGAEHPSYAVVVDWLPKVDMPYAWYMRVPDLPDFISTITPVLERRLAESVMVGHSGELTLSFYRSGLKLVLERGHLSAVEAWMPEGDVGMARFPGLTFLQLLFGYRSFSELDAAFADCFASREARLLLDALFPRRASDFWPVA